MRKRFALNALIVLLAVLALFLVFGPRSYLVQNTSAQGTKDAKAGVVVKPTTGASLPSMEDNQLTPKSPAAYDPNWERGEYPQDQRNKLLAFPNLRPGDITPVKLYLYGGPGASSYASIDDVGDFREFYTRLSEQKPAVMARWKAYLDTRYDFSGKTDPVVTMARGKHIPVGPVVKLPDGVKSWEDLATLTAAEMLKRDLFPEGFRPLAHPLQSTGHM